MRKITVLLLVLAFLFTGNNTFSQEKPLGSSITKDLKDQMDQNKKDDLIRINIRLTNQFDIQNFEKYMPKLNREAKRIMVIKELKDFSTKTQEGIITYLDSKEKENQVKVIYKLWINNVITCMASKEVISNLSHRSDIDRIDWDEEQKMIIENEIFHGDEGLQGDKGVDEITWNVSKVNADDVWALGYTGSGITVGIIDTGVNYNHVDLQDHMWTDPSYPNHGYDFANNDNDPMDDHSHGTHCAGTVAGDGTAGSQTGMAPNATIMALKVLTSSGNGAESNVWSAIQFFVDHGGDIMSMSIGWLHSNNPDRESWRNAHNNALAAGVIAAVAAGNEDGSITDPDDVRTPGDCPPPWLHPDQTLTGGLSNVVCVGATDISDNIASFSSLGPVDWSAVNSFNDYPYNPELGLIRPDVSAPGVNIKSLDYASNNGYADGWNGTSMATPCVAGIMALMLEKIPSLTPAQINIAIETNAVELGTAGKDNVFGSGRIDALAAINSLEFTANFSSDITNVCTGGSVDFTDLSGPSPTSWSWSFPGGSPASSGSQNPTVTYNTPGTYNVTLIAGDGIDTDTETKTAYITVENVFADFTGISTTVVVGNTVTFTDNSGCNPTTWNWSFPNGTPATASGIGPHIISYNTLGTYDVSLTVTKGASNDTETKSGYISVVPPEFNMTNGTVTTCTGNFYDSGGPSGSYLNNEDFTMTFYPSTAGAMLEFDFTTFSIEYQSTCNYDYLNIYDGENTSATQIGQYCGTNSPGFFTATNPAGAITFQFHSDVSVTDIGWVASISCYSTTDPPVADFTADNVTPFVGHWVNFNDASTGEPNSWSWSFNPSTVTYVNGNFTSQNPSVTFDAPGTYTVTLTATNSNGSDDEIKTNYINVSPSPPLCSGDVDIDGNGTSPWNYPLSTYYEDARITSIYLASEFECSGGSITAMQYYISTAPGQTLNNFTIRIRYPFGEQNYYSVPGFGVNGWTTVYQANETIGSTGWHTFNFTTPFNYNGLNNIEVDVCFNNSSWSSDGNIYSFDAGVNRTKYYRCDGCNYPVEDPLDWTNDGNLTTNVPRAIFKFVAPGLWTGTTSNDWGITTNWDDSNIPVAGTDVTIPTSPLGGIFPETNTGAGAECNNLTIESAAHLFIPSDNTLTVNGNLDNNAGTNSLVVKSNVNGTGSLIHNTANVDATVERYLIDGRWHFIGIPVSSSLVDIFHLPTGHSDIYLRTHIEATNTWDAYIVPLGTSLALGRGYETWVGDPFGFSQPETIEFFGTLNSGDFTTGSGGFYGLQYTSGHGLNLISNPYPSALQGNINTWPKSNVANSIWTWSKSYGNYVYWGSGNDYTWGTPAFGTMNAGVIPAMQGFFVEATGSSPSVTIPQTDRIHSSQAYYKESEIPSNTLQLEVNANDYKDVVFITFNEAADEAHDDYDVKKLFGLQEAPQLYSIISGEQLSINALPELKEYRMVQLGFECGFPGSYAFSASDIESFNGSASIYLEDTKEGAMQDLTSNPVYSFTYGLSDELTRFVIHFGDPNGIDEGALSTISIYSNGDMVYVQRPQGFDGIVTIFDMLGQEIDSQTAIGKGLIRIPVKSGTGYYFVKVQSDGQLFTEKVFIK